MKLYGKCKTCESEIGFRADSYTRVEFAMNEGETKKLSCHNCVEEDEIHVDDIYTKESKVAQIVAGLIFLLGTPLIFFLTSSILSQSRNHYVIYVVTGFLLVPVFVYITIKKQDQTRVSSFNKRKLKGRIHNI